MPKSIHRRRDADPREGLAKYGRAIFADPVNKKYPTDTPGRIKAAWAYVHQPSNAEKYTASELRTLKTRIREAAKARKMGLPDPEEFVELMARVRKKKGETHAEKVGPAHPSSPAARSRARRRLPR
jgi:hypothetical protein